MFFEQIIYKRCARDVNTTSIFERHLSLNDSFLYKISGFHITFSEINLWRRVEDVFITAITTSKMSEHFITPFQNTTLAVLAVFKKKRKIYIVIK